MRKKYLSAALAATLLSTAAATVHAQPTEGGGSYESVATAPQSNSKCTGFVTDEDDEPLAGASVFVVGTQNGASTDVDGKFSLANVAKGAKIKISFIGYNPIEVEWTGTPISVKLVPAGDALDRC